MEQVQVREKPVEGLDADEVRIFDLMQEADQDDSCWYEQTAFELRNWFTKAIRSYLASGCNPTTLRRALGSLPEVARKAPGRVGPWSGEDLRFRLMMYAEHGEAGGADVRA